MNTQNNSVQKYPEMYTGKWTYFQVAIMDEILEI